MTTAERITKRIQLGGIMLPLFFSTTIMLVAFVFGLFAQGYIDTSRFKVLSVRIDAMNIALAAADAANYQALQASFRRQQKENSDSLAMMVGEVTKIREDVARMEGSLR